MGTFENRVSGDNETAELEQAFDSWLTLDPAMLGRPCPIVVISKKVGNDDH